MENKLALKIIMFVSLGGALFSGYLSFQELIRGNCPVGGCSTLLGLPVCVYGFLMYMVVFVISLLSYRKSS